MVASAAACSNQRVGRTPLPDGSFRIECRKSLAFCLDELTEDICRDYGYDVVQAKEVVTRNGVEPVNSIVTTSEAVIRCRSSGALIGDAAKTPAAAPVASQATPARGCFPGSTQACLGPGACKGAQTCGADGARFGSCDCGGAAATPTPAPPLDTMPPVSDGGAP